MPVQQGAAVAELATGRIKPTDTVDADNVKTVTCLDAYSFWRTHNCLRSLPIRAGGRWTPRLQHRPLQRINLLFRAAAHEFDEVVPFAEIGLRSPARCHMTASFGAHHIMIV
jgi:hypothetical protein